MTQRFNVQSTSRWLLRLGPLAAVFLLTGAVNVSCAGDPASSTGGGTGPGSSRPASHAMSQWTPVSGVDTCTQAEHDEYFVVGPDGKKYPTWHAATHTRSNNTTCTFGHEHGDSPRDSTIFVEIKRHFAYDDNGNGTLEDGEVAVSGVPFGYVAEQLDLYNASGAGSQGQRHQPHTAYKIAVAGGNRDRLNGGALLTKDFVPCNHLVAFNQDTASADAFASNLHEAIVALDCGTTGLYPVRLIVSGMMSFGDRGNFDASALASTVKQEQVVAGGAPANQTLGITGLRRAIPAEVGGVNRLRDSAFVASGVESNLQDAFSELWAATFSLTEGATTVATVRPAITARLPSRFYDPAAASFVGRTIDLCYSGLNAGGIRISDPAQAATIVRSVRAAAGGSSALCFPLGSDAGRLTAAVSSRVAYDAVASPFRNCKRQVTFGNVTVANGGATTRYSDPFGGNLNDARSNARPVKQFIAAVNTSTLAAGGITGIELAPLSYGDAIDHCSLGGVHLPN